MTTEQIARPRLGTSLAEALELDFPQRSRKPRAAGLTMVMDTGWPVDFVGDVLRSFGEYLDIVKLWDTHLRVPEAEVRRKIDLYHQHGVRVQPGGIFLEIARAQGRGMELLDRLRQLGCDIVEISATAAIDERELEADAALARRARDLGLEVFGEVGKKFFEGDSTRTAEDRIDVEATIAEMKALLDAGATHVYWEGHLLRRVVGDDPETIRQHASTGCVEVPKVVSAVGLDKIIFEVSALRPLLNRRTLQFWLVRTFGPEVNIGNARLEELPHIEAIRSGHHPIFGFGQAGNYPWLRSLLARNGVASPTWWKDDE